MLNAHDPSALSESNSSPRRLALLAPVRFTAGFLAFSGRRFLQLRHEPGAGWLGFAPLIFIFAIFYFLLIMPQQRRQKKWQHMLSELKTGDKVVTSGGIRGTVMAIK